MSRFAIIGFGCAGYNALRAIRESGSEAEVDVYSPFPHPPANPMLTTYYVKGKIPYEAMFPLLGVAVVYLVLVMLFTWLLSKFERRMAQGDR